MSIPSEAQFDMMESALVSGDREDELRACGWKWNANLGRGPSGIVLEVMRLPPGPPRRFRTVYVPDNPERPIVWDVHDGTAGRLEDENGHALE